MGCTSPARNVSGGTANISRDIRVNEKIRAREVRVIGEDGQQLGVHSQFAALNMARERGLDLVEVAPNSIPPVCRLMDFGRYKYEQQKKEQEAHRAQRTNDLKEVRMAPVIDEHDIETKTKMIRRFVEDGDKVKVTIQFRGAQMRHQEIGRDVLERILTILRGTAVLERPIIMEGRNMSMFVGAPLGARAAAAPGAPIATRPGPEGRAGQVPSLADAEQAEPGTEGLAVVTPSTPSPVEHAASVPSGTPLAPPAVVPPVRRGDASQSPTNGAPATRPVRSRPPVRS